MKRCLAKDGACKALGADDGVQSRLSQKRARCWPAPDNAMTLLLSNEHDTPRACLSCHYCLLVRPPCPPPAPALPSPWPSSPARRVHAVDGSMHTSGPILISLRPSRRANPMEKRNATSGQTSFPPKRESQSQTPVGEKIEPLGPLLNSDLPDAFCALRLTT